MEAWFYFLNYVSKNNLFANNFYDFVLVGRTKMLQFYLGESLSVLSTQGNSFVLPSDMYESFPSFDFHHFLVEYPYAPVETLKTASSFIILNLVNKGFLHILIINGLSTIASQEHLLIEYLVEYF